MYNFIGGATDDESCFLVRRGQIDENSSIHPRYCKINKCIIIKKRLDNSISLGRAHFSLSTVPNIQLYHLFCRL